MGRACGTYGGEQMHTGLLMGRSDGKIPFGRPGRIWDDNIKMYIQELGGGTWTRFLLLRIVKVGGR